jgi:hypothetical protein
MLKLKAKRAAHPQSDPPFGLVTLPVRFLDLAFVVIIIAHLQATGGEGGLKR